MKPFSKFEALSGKPVVTRDGRKVVYITEIPQYDLTLTYPVVALVEGASGPHTYTSDGRYIQPHQEEGSSGSQCLLDLFMSSEKKEGWVAFGTRKLGLVGFTTHVWATEKEAKESYYASNGGKEPAGTVKVSWEE